VRNAAHPRQAAGLRVSHEDAASSGAPPGSGSAKRRRPAAAPARAASQPTRAGAMSRPATGPDILTPELDQLVAFSAQRSAATTERRRPTPAARSRVAPMVVSRTLNLRSNCKLVWTGHLRWAVRPYRRQWTLSAATVAVRAAVRLDLVIRRDMSVAAGCWLAHRQLWSSGHSAADRRHPQGSGIGQPTAGRLARCRGQGMRRPCHRSMRPIAGAYILGMRRGLLVVTVFLVLAGCGSATRAGNGLVSTAGCGLPTAAPVMTVDGTAQPANQSALDEIANRVQSYSVEHFSGVYAGVEIRSESNRVRVFRVPSADFDAWILGQFRTVCVEVADARHSRQELVALQRRIVGDVDYWNARGIPINTVGVARDGSGVQVTTTDVAKASQELPARYGSDAPIKITYGDRPHDY
jgi:hypothetical protein